MITVPENIIRAIAAAPATFIRDVTLGALGLYPDLEPNTEDERQSALEQLEQLSGAAEQVELV